MMWPTKKLGDCLVQFDRGISWSRKDEGGTVAVLRIPNIEEGHINLDDLKHIDPKNGNGELDKNDIVMVASNGNPDLVGRSALVTEDEKGMRFASFLIRLRIDNTKLLSQYAHLFLLTPTFKRELRRKIATTSGIYNLKKDHIEKIKIPLPPIATQKQIVERLDKIAEAQKLNDELIQKTDELFQSLLHKELNPAGLTYAPTKQHTNKLEYVGMSGSHSKTPADASAFVKTSADKRAMAGKKDWEIKKLGECMIQFDRGISWSRKDEGGAIAVLRIPNIEEGHINLNDLKHIDPKNGNGELDKNDIVMVASNGNPDLVGRSALVAEKEKGMRFASFLVRLRLDDTKLLSHYAHLFLLTPTFKRELRRKIATTSGIYNLRKEHVEKIKISLPPLETQKQIVAKLSAVQDYKKQLLGQKAKLKELFDSALHKSMTQRPH